MHKSHHQIIVLPSEDAVENGIKDEHAKHFSHGEVITIRRLLSQIVNADPLATRLEEGYDVGTDACTSWCEEAHTTLGRSAECIVVGLVGKR